MECRRHHLTSNGWSFHWHGQGWGRCGSCRGVPVPVARAGASFLQPEWGGKDRWGIKFSWRVFMQQTSLISSSSIHWAASCWLCFSPSKVLWILFGGWLYVAGSGPGFPGYSSIFTLADRLSARGTQQCCYRWSRMVAMGTRVVPPQVNQSEKMQGCICSHSVSTRGASGLIAAFIDQSSTVLNSLSFWSVLGESTYITASSHITAVITHTALKTLPI